jgi:hypothetical protein
VFRRFESSGNHLIVCLVIRIGQSGESGRDRGTTRNTSSARLTGSSNINVVKFLKFLVPHYYPFLWWGAHSIIDPRRQPWPTEGWGSQPSAV